jgi:hypothetical protein
MDTRRVVLAFLLLFVLDGGRAQQESLQPKTVEQPSLPQGSPLFTVLNVNRLSLWVRNDGWSARDPETGNAGLTYPRGTTATVIFQDGLLWGCNTHRTQRPIRVGGQYYAIGTIGGNILAPGIPQDPSDPSVRIYRIRRDFRTADLTADAAELYHVSVGGVTPAMIETVRAQYERDWNEWPWQQGAPYYDLNNNNVKDPNEDPGLADADQVIWFVAHDLLRCREFCPPFDAGPIGLELQVTLWAYNRESPWDECLFKRLRLIYKGAGSSGGSSDTTLTDMYLGVWSDPDLGYYANDFVGCDTTLNLAYAYNATPTDSVYAAWDLVPPAFGYSLMQGPRIVTGNPSDTAIFNMRKVAGAKNLPMTAFSYFASGDIYAHPPYNYNGALQWYQMMKGLPPIPLGPPDPPPRPDFVTRQPTRFWLSGNPLTRTGWIDGLAEGPGDRHLQMFTGPFSMALGDTQEIVVAEVAAMGANNLNSVAVLKSSVQRIRESYARLLQDVPRVPPSVPESYALSQNYPNPFNSETTISYTTPHDEFVSLKVYDLTGREVATLVHGMRSAGRKFVTWDARGFASGVYFYRMEAGRFTQTRKLILLR